MAMPLERVSMIRAVAVLVESRFATAVGLWGMGMRFSMGALARGRAEICDVVRRVVGEWLGG
jgi:hypothetical protein